MNQIGSPMSAVSVISNISVESIKEKEFKQSKDLFPKHKGSALLSQESKVLTFEEETKSENTSQISLKFIKNS
jgi:hypothetical protein